MEIIEKKLINKNLDSFIIYIISLIPVLLITGAFLPDLSITICAVFFFFYLKKNKFIFDKKKKFFSIFFSVFYLAIIISSLYSRDLKLYLNLLQL